MIFTKVFFVLVIIGIALLIFIDKSAIIKIISWSIHFHDDFTSAVSYATVGYSLDVKHAYPPL